ncbi:hypothetical protein [Pelotomaculum isophthalicicum]|nr:hypothetical protein [Pelotomaculum isophthalicicum]
MTVVNSHIKLNYGDYRLLSEDRNTLVNDSCCYMFKERGIESD